MIGVAENDRNAQFLEIAHRHRLDGALGSDRHKDGRLDDAVRGRDETAAGAPIPMRDVKGKGQVASLAIIRS